MIKLHSIETFWAHEWPGLRIVFFTQWCLMKCLYCHNPDTIKMDGWTEYSPEELLEKAYKSKPYFWSKWWVTMSGWECLLQARDLIPFFKLLKEHWFHTCLDTNGFILNDDVKELLEYTDLVLLDIKHFYEDEHKKLTWVSNTPIFSFAKYLDEIQKTIWIRHVLVPNFTDNEKHLEDLWAYFKNFKTLERLEILPYHTLWVHKWRELWMNYELEDTIPPSVWELLKAKEILEKNIKNVFIRR